MTDVYQVGEASCNLDNLSEKGFAKNDKVKWITNLFVPKEHRQKGLAKALLSQLGKEADAAQIALMVECRVYEQDAIEEDKLEFLYKRQGFIKLQDKPKLLVRIPVPPMLLANLKQKPVSRIITNIYS